jgi:hypothetical protein
MSGPLLVNRCMSCGRPRPDERWALGLDALLAEDRVGWLCEDCEARPGRAWGFVDAVRRLYPAAVLLSTTAYAGRVVQAAVALPDPEPGGPPAPAPPRRPGARRLLPGKPADDRRAAPARADATPPPSDDGDGEGWRREGRAAPVRLDLLVRRLMAERRARLAGEEPGGSTTRGA